MPPKVSKKNEKAQKQKSVEDKTFGLKNKNKSTKIAKYVQQVEQNAFASGSKKQQDIDKLNRQKEEEKKRKKKEQEEMAELFKPIQVQQKVPFGTDPKSILCAFFKAGTCQKGNKCKFSHDSKSERKSGKIDLYTDNRDGKEEDTIDKWDESKLAEVVKSKHGNPQTTTDIVCKFFLEAIENQKYGWFWDCPNGVDKCKYKHALPPGFVFKKKKGEEEKEEISIEEFLEKERLNLPKTLTPVTLESFKLWKQTRKAKQEAEEKKIQAKKEQQFKAGKNVGISGKDLFTFNPDLMGDEEDDDEDGFDLNDYRKETLDQERKLEEEMKDLALKANTLAHEEGKTAKEVIDRELFSKEDVGDLSD